MFPEGIKSYSSTEHCGLKNILVFLSPTPKTNGGHENRAKSVWESSFIEILDLSPWP